MYSEKELAALEEKNIEFPDGSMHTFYEAEQYQRALERRIRESKRILAGTDELIKNTAEESVKLSLQREFNIQSLKLKDQEARLKTFYNKTKLPNDNSRVHTFGFGKSTSQKAVHIEKAVSQVNDLYKTDIGYMKPYKIYELDQIALKEKQLNFTGKFKKSGNIAVMEYNGQYYFSHSMANSYNGKETAAFSKYKGDKSHLAVTSERAEERVFVTFDVNQSDGRRFSGNLGDLREQTFYDTEAKLFESLENMWYNTDAKDIYILSERGMCDSCKSVAKQFMTKHPEANVNMVSGKQNTGNPWKGRKYLA